MGESHYRDQLVTAVRGGDTVTAIRLLAQLQQSGVDITNLPAYRIAAAKSFLKRRDWEGAEENLNKLAELILGDGK